MRTAADQFDKKAAAEHLGLTVANLNKIRHRDSRRIDDPDDNNPKPRFPVPTALVSGAPWWTGSQLDGWRDAMKRWNEQLRQAKELRQVRGEGTWNPQP